MRKVLILLLLLLSAGWCAAQGTPGSVELTPMVGYWFGDALTQGTSNAIPFDVTIDDAPAYGLRLAYRLSEHWALEGTLVYENADLVTGSGDIFEGSSKLGEMELTTGELGFEVSFGSSRLVPFLAGGIGLMHLAPDVPGLSSDTRFAANFGVGLKLFLTPELALRLDWRGHGVDVGGGDSDWDCDGWDDCCGCGGCGYWDCDYDDEWLGFSEVSLGLTFVF